MRDRPHHLQPYLETVRIALVYHDVTGGGVSHVGLGVTAAYTMKTLRQHGIWAEVWPTPSTQKLRERLRAAHASADQRGELRPTHVVLAAPWIPPSDLAALAADPEAVRRLRETAELQLASHNVFVGGNSAKFTDWATEAWGIHAVYLPNLYCLSETFPQNDRHWTGGPLRLGLFGANRPLKNFLSGAAAAVELARRLRVPIELLLSSGRNEGGDARALDEMTESVANLRVTRVGWLPWPGFRRLLRTVDLVLQPSYTETFNVVTADSIAEGVPVVASDAIDWVPSWWQARADEPLDVARVAERLLRDPNAPRQGREALQAYVDRGVVAWWKFLCPQLSTVARTEAPPRTATDHT